jgi:MSHA biogenesis protein MshN
MGAAEMSVINTMLRDLEQRDGKSDLSKEEILQGLSSGRAGVRRDGVNPYLMSLFSVLAVVAVLAAVYLYSPYRLIAAQRAEPSDAQPKPAAEATSIAATSAMTTIADDRTVAAPRPMAIAGEVRTVQPEPTTVAEQAVPEKTVLAQADKPMQAQKLPHTAASSDAPDKKASDGNGSTVKRTESNAARAAAVIKPNIAQDAALLSDGNEQSVSKTRREPSDSAKSENAYASAMDLYSQGRTEESRVQLKQALGLDPSNNKASLLLAAIYLGDNRPELAKTVLEKGLKIQSTDQGLLRMYLQVQVQMKYYAQAISIMERRIRANSPEDIAYLAGLYQKNNDHLGAVRLYAQALNLMPSNSVWWMGQGISFEALGMNEEAIKSYRQSIESGRLNTQLAEYVLGRIASIEKSVKDPVS